MDSSNNSTNTGPQGTYGSGPLPTGPTPNIPGSDKVAAQQAQLKIQNQLSSQFGLGDIFSGVGDVWKWIGEHAGDLVPKDARNADGSIDWTKLGTDAISGLGHFLSDHKQDILTALNVVNQTQRQNKADELGAEGVERAKKRWDTQEPLRLAGQAGMLDPSKNTPDLSRLGAQSQNGLSVQAPLPLAPSRQNLANAGTIAGPGGGNPFAKPLPLAPVPMAAPAMPGMPGGQPFTPSKPGALPLAPAAPQPAPNGIPTRPISPDAPGFSPTAPGRPTIEPITPKRRIYDPNDPTMNALALPLASGY